MEMRREGKEVAFQVETFFFYNNKHTACFFLIFIKIYSRKNKFRFFK